MSPAPGTLSRGDRLLLYLAAAEDMDLDQAAVFVGRPREDLESAWPFATALVERVRRPREPIPPPNGLPYEPPWP